MAKPTDLPTPKDKKTGLTLGATVGIAIGIALLVIGGALIAWIVVRRRRRTWGKKRKAEGDPESKGVSPNEEIAKKVGVDNSLNKEFRGTNEKQERMSEGAAEIDGEHITRAEMPGGDIGKTSYDKSRLLSELHAESNVLEMPGTSISPVEIGGSTFVAELDGTNIPATSKPPTFEPPHTADLDLKVKDERKPTKPNDNKITETTT